MRVRRRTGAHALAGVAVVLLVAGGTVAAPGVARAATPRVSSSDWLGEINYYRTGSGLAPVTQNSFSASFAISGRPSAVNSG